MTNQAGAAGRANGAGGQPRKNLGPRAADLDLDGAIETARQGRVNLSPGKAVEMASRLYARGEFDEAARVSRQIIAARPANADAHNILGAALAALGKPDEAVASLQRAIRLSPDASSYRSNLGEILRRSGALVEATVELDAAIRLDAGNAQALNNRGIIHFEREEFAEAVDLYHRARAADPALTEVFNNLGNALRSMGDHAAALDCYEQALTDRAVYPEVYNNLGTLLHKEGRFEQAEHALRKAIQQKPDYADAHNNLAQLLFAQKHEIEALRILGDALKFAPLDADLLLTTARVQLHRHNLEAAEQAARIVIQQDPDHAGAWLMLGQVMHETDRYDEAIVALERALGSEPGNAEALNFYGVALKSVGRLDEAREAILGALKLNDSKYGAFANLNDLVDFSTADGEALFERMHAIFESIEDPEQEQFTALHFAYAKALDDRGRHEEALHHYTVGGRLKRAQLRYDEAETHAFFDAIRAAFPKERFEKRSFAGIDDERFVFIVGMPRSGSTLVEQIIASHPDVHGAGEVKFLAQAIGQLRDRFPALPAYPEAVGMLSAAQLDILAGHYRDALSEGAGPARRITDKLLTNFFFIGLINLLFPKARIIHTRRDPVDTCLSGFTKLFKDDMPHSYDLGELGRYYRKYDELMAHWEKVLPDNIMTTIVYEDVVSDLEGEARRLIEFLGLPWDSRCVEFHKSDRPVKTASVAQVRRPIYKSSVARARKYGDGLQPLIAALEGARKLGTGRRRRG